MAASFATCCVLSYNRPQFLKQMLATMIANAQHPMEVIVHDDGSSDLELRRWLNEELHEGRISTLILNPPGHNQGQGIALNRMFHMAKGDPILKLDHDLVFRPGWLKQVVTVLNENAKDPSTPEIGALGLHRYDADPVAYDKMFLREWPGWIECEDFVGSGFAVPARIWRRVGPFEERSAAFAEDYEYKMKMRDHFDLKLGLVAQDVAVNQGFGLGPSTVAVERDGQLTSELIKTEPVIL